MPIKGRDQDDKHPLTPAQDSAHSRYVQRKLARGEDPKSPAAWKESVDFWRSRSDKGEYWRTGMSDFVEHTPKYGWQYERGIENIQGHIYDAVEVNRRIVDEYKSGAVQKKRGLRQLEADNQ